MVNNLTIVKNLQIIICNNQLLQCFLYNNLSIGIILQLELVFFKECCKKSHKIIFEQISLYFVKREDQILMLHATD